MAEKALYKVNVDFKKGALIRSKAGMLPDTIGLDLQFVPVRVHISNRYEVI